MADPTSGRPAQTTPTGSEKPPEGRPTLTLKLGSATLEGPAAAAVLFFILVLIGWGLVLIHPSARMLIAAALWIAFFVYWGTKARDAAPTKSSESVESRRLHQYLLNGSLLLLFIPVPGLRSRFMPLLTALVIGGLALQCAGFLLAAWARRHLGRNWSGAVTIAVGHQLVRSGPYRLVRHPIYTAMIAMYAGTAIVSGELHALLALAVVSGAYWRKIRLEEQNLRHAFGVEYEAYQHATWALIPGVY